VDGDLGIAAQAVGAAQVGFGGVEVTEAVLTQPMLSMMKGSSGAIASAFSIRARASSRRTLRSASE
jgi:hypothetical protein